MKHRLALVASSSLLLAVNGVAQVQIAPIAPAPIAPALSVWPGYARDPSHNAISGVSAQNLSRIKWQTPVDLMPQYSGSSLLIHYGSPLVTPAGMVLVTVKTQASGSYQVEGHLSSTGATVWTTTTDYVLPPHGWTPSVGSTLTTQNDLVIPAIGGTVLYRSTPDLVGGSVRRDAFFGMSNYNANPAAYDASVFISTPITADAAGNLYFGFVVRGTTPLNLVSGLARISAGGVGSWVSAANAANDTAIRKVVYNCAPALSRDGSSVYVAVTNTNNSGFGTGYLVKLDSTTLAMQARVRLKDVSVPTLDARLPDDGTASPTVGPDGDVYFGVFEGSGVNNHSRGWLTHFDANLTQTKLGSAFGWDDTASVVPRAAVPGYTGPSAYLLLTKYNNYGYPGGGDGLNKLAVIDPNVSMVDPISGATVMNTVRTILGPTPDQNWPGGVREWCINTAAIDVARHCAIVNCEDGKVYRWDLGTNTLLDPVVLTVGIGEAYTPTIIGHDGTSYAINNGILFALGQ
ncbi:MAG: hypothetical protein R3F56_20090 [Planctomycetota bacterium]